MTALVDIQTGVAANEKQSKKWRHGKVTMISRMISEDAYLE
jgi:hypothetical protein